MAKIGLYFGSFNPIHNGHLIVAQFMMNTGLFDKIRFVVSPQNPFKTIADLMDENLRLALVKTAIKNNAYFEFSDVEFNLPKPSFTIQTLNFFVEKEPENTFSILIGSDNLEQLDDWKNIEEISKICSFHVYQRRGSENKHPSFPVRYKLYEAPFLDISATYIRELLANGKSIQYLVPEGVWDTLKPG